MSNVSTRVSPFIARFVPNELDYYSSQTDRSTKNPSAEIAEGFGLYRGRLPNVTPE